MARIPIGKLSATWLRTAKPKPGQRALRKGDGGNLYFQATWAANGVDVNRSWLFRYEINGQSHEMGLGPLHTLSLAEAREKARLLRQQLLESIDPLIARQARQQAAAAESAKRITFDECATAFITSHRAGWRNVAHANQWTATLQTYASPVMGKLPVQAIDTAVIMKALEPIWTAKIETASRVRGRIESVLNWAIARGYRTGPNPAAWRGHLDKLLPSKRKIRAVKHHSSLPFVEAPAFMARLRATEGTAARALEFLALVAARAGEVVDGADWTEVDVRAKLWTVPPQRTKSGRQHVVPLSPAAMAVLTAMAANGTEGRIFPISKTTLLETMRRLAPGYVPHGLRATFKTWASERTNFPREVVEAALAHVIADKTEAAYARGSMIERRRKLMEAWAAFLSKPAATEAAVIPIQLTS